MRCAATDVRLEWVLVESSVWMGNGWLPLMCVSSGLRNRAFRWGMAGFDVVCCRSCSSRVGVCGLERLDGEWLAATDVRLERPASTLGMAGCDAVMLLTFRTGACGIECLHR